MGEILIITGYSGAGKTVALKKFEDFGYYCIDNIPVEIVEKLISLVFSDNILKIALGVDIRQENDFIKLKELLKKWDKKKLEYKIIFLSAKIDTLINRYKETRRLHPLQIDKSLTEAIQLEMKKLEWLKLKSDKVIKTDNCNNYDLGKLLEKKVLAIKNTEKSLFIINIMSFGYKYGIPHDADYVLDVRFIKNPYYVDNLRLKTGLNNEVKKYCLLDKRFMQFVSKFLNLFSFILKSFEKEGKNNITIYFGCTGGKHRSVLVASEIAKELIKSNKYKVTVKHRDIDK